MASKNYDDLSREELIRLLSARDQRDKTRFGLVWEANEIERENALNNDFVALDFIPELSCGGTGVPPVNTPTGETPVPHAFKNLIIEGDNFDALRYLKMCFAGRVKCIYIDPPYNTGNKDFVYNDRYVDKEDLWRHSKWCEFMFQRLTLAKDLLSQDGVIFVSIDDNELPHLLLLMGRIFGETNFVANVIWQKVFAPKNTARHFSADHEYVVVFARHGETWTPKLLPRTEAQDKAYKNPDKDLRGPWKASDTVARNYYSKGTYAITTPAGRVIPGPRPGTYWRVAQEKFLELVADNRVWWGKSGDNFPMIKRFRTDVMDGRVPQTLWPYEEVGHTKEAKEELNEATGLAMGESVFSTPKPTRLIDRILRLSTDPDSLILDFFAGSGTTAHAVHKLNKEDGGNRRVILVSSTEATDDEPDKNLCRDVCATRVRRVIEGYAPTGETKDAVPGLGGDFAYLRTRRIAPGRLTDIDHAQVWTALQLTHMPVMKPFDEAERIATADHEEQRLIYVPHFMSRDVRPLVKRVKERPSVIVYTWQMDYVRNKLRDCNNVQVEAIPDALARRFGIRI